MFFLRASLGFALSGLAQHDEAVKILRESHASQLQADAIGIEHAHTLRTASLLGGALMAQGEIEQGVAMLEETLETQTRVLSAEVYDTRRTAKRLTAAALKVDKTALRASE